MMINGKHNETWSTIQIKQMHEMTLMQPLRVVTAATSRSNQFHLECMCICLNTEKISKYIKGHETKSSKYQYLTTQTSYFKQVREIYYQHPA